MRGALLHSQMGPELKPEMPGGGMVLARSGAQIMVRKHLTHVWYN